MHFRLMLVDFHVSTARISKIRKLKIKKLKSKKEVWRTIEAFLFSCVFSRATQTP